MINSLLKAVKKTMLFYIDNWHINPDNNKLCYVKYFAVTCCALIPLMYNVLLLITLTPHPLPTKKKSTFIMSIDTPVNLKQKIPAHHPGLKVIRTATRTAL